MRRGSRKIPDVPVRESKLVESVLKGDAVRVRSLLDKRKFSLMNIPDSQGHLPKSCEKSSKHRHVYIPCSEWPAAALTTEDINRLVEACRLGNMEMVDLLIGSSDDLRVIQTADGNGMTPLHAACGGGHDKVVARLLEKGAPTEAADVEGCTAIHIAAQNGYLDVLQVLLAFSADKEKLDKDKCTALLRACRYQKVEAARLLIRADANVQVADLNGCTPLMVCCQIGAVDIVSALIERGAWVNVEDGRGWTAKQYALESGNTNCVLALPRSAITPSTSSSHDISAEHAKLKKTLEEVSKELEIAQGELAGERKERERLVSELEALEARLIACNAGRDNDDDDDEDVVFSSDDDVLGETQHKGDSTSDDKDTVKLLRSQMATVRLENAKLRKQLFGEFQENDPEDIRGTLIAKLKSELHEKTQMLEACAGNIPTIPFSLYEELKASHSAELKRKQDQLVAERKEHEEHLEQLGLLPQTEKHPKIIDRSPSPPSLAPKSSSEAAITSCENASAPSHIMDAEIKSLKALVTAYQRSLLLAYKGQLTSQLKGVLASISDSGESAA